MSSRIGRIARTSLLALAMLVAGATGVSRASAQELPADPLQRQTALLARIEAAVAARDYRGAEAALVSNRFDGGENAFRAAFLLAIIKARTGNLEEAERRLREILARRPAYERVRLELASVLAAQGRRDAASFQLRKLADAANDGRTRDQLEALIDRINPRGGLAASAFMTLAPSTNINGGTQNSTIYINGLPFTVTQGGRAESGIGLTTGVVGSYTHTLSESLSAFVAGSLSFTDYADTIYDKPAIEIRTGLSRRGITYLLSAELIADRIWIGGAPNSHGLGGRLTARWNFAPRWLVSGDTTYITRFSDVAGGANTRTWRTSATLRFSPDSAQAWWVGGEVETENVEKRDFASYVKTAARVGHSRDLAYGITLSAEAEFGRRAYNGIFPLMREAREDTFAEFRVTALKRDFQLFGLTPRIGVGYFVQKSNVALYDYDRWSGDLTLTKEF
jgi:Thioredoxin domain-containing protein